MVLDFGLIGGNLFTNSDATGEGLNTSRDAVILRQIGFQSVAIKKDETEYSQNNNTWTAKISKVFTPPTENHIIAGIQLVTELKMEIGAGSRRAECRLSSTFGTSSHLLSNMNNTYVKRTLMQIPSDYTPDTSYNITVQLRMSTSGDPWDAFMKNTIVTIYFFDGISLTKDSSLFT